MAAEEEEEEFPPFACLKPWAEMSSCALLPFSLRASLRGGIRQRLEAINRLLA